MAEFWIEVEASDGTRYGQIRTAQSWESTGRMDRAGTFRFVMPAADSHAALVQARRVARCYTLINGAVTEIGAGIIDQISVSVDTNNQANLLVSGDDLLRELTFRHVGALVIDDGAGAADVTGPADIIALAPSGWTLDTTNGYDETLKAILHTFEGETVLAALIRLAELTGEHFRLGSGRTVIWMQADLPDSGIIAVSGASWEIEDTPSRCVITSLEQVKDSYEALVGRVYAYGVGTGDGRYDLNGASTAYSGYAIGNDSKGYYLQHTATWSAYGIDRYVSFKDISSQATLVEAAYEWMRQQLTAPVSYRVGIGGLLETLTVNSTLRIVYSQWVNGYQAVGIDADLRILEATTRIDTRGVRTVGVQVSTAESWPENDTSAVVGAVGQSSNYYTHPQPVGSGVIGTHTHTFGDISDALDLGGAGALTIASGAVTKTKSYHKIDTESSAASDDLDTISGGSEGDVLVLRAANDGRTVVCKNATGNLYLAGSDFSLDNVNDKLMLIHDGINWNELSRSDNGA